MGKENDGNLNAPPEAEPVEQAAPLEKEVRPGWREIFRQAFDKARHEQAPVNRSGLGRDRSRSLLLLAGAAIAFVLLFLCVFSSPNRVRKGVNERRPGAANLGRPMTSDGLAAGQAESTTPLLTAQVQQSGVAGSKDLTAEDVDKTARPIRNSVEVQPNPAGTVPGKGGLHTLGQIDFGQPSVDERAPGLAESPKSLSDELRKPSLVFVRSAQNTPTVKATTGSSSETEEVPTLILPTGTKLVARLESLVTSAVKEPVVAAIEYDYERDGAIVVPAGAKALGSLQEADRSGNVAIRFNSIQMPDGTMEKIDATAMSLTYGPLKGSVSGKRTGTNFLVRAFTGVGQAATYLVGSGGMNAPLSESAFLRDRIATNIGIAGDQELNDLTFNQNIVVTVPGNTRFYLVMEHGAAVPEGQGQANTARLANTAPPPSLEELRELLQLRQEMSAMYQQAGNAAEQVPQQ
jgi:hypothetical protein